VTEALCRAGLTVREAASGTDALRLAAGGPAAIVLGDHLPDLSGPKVCSLLKADPATATIPVLCLGPWPNEEGLPETGRPEARLDAAEPTQLVAAVIGLLHLRAESLRGAVERLRSMVDTALDGIVTISESGIIETFNPAAERLFGYRAGEVIGLNVNVLMPEPYRGEHDGYIAAYRRTGVAKVIGIGREVVALRKDGSTFPMDLAVSAFRLGGRRCFTGIIHDITERKRLEGELGRRAEELALADQRKDEFLALLGHELRNPLAPLRTAVQLLEKKGDDPAVVAHMREIIDRQVGQMTRLVDQLLDASRIARAKVQVRREPLDLAALVRTAAGDHRAELEAAGLLVMEVAAGPVWVRGDAARLTQVVGNLLHNAQKFTDPGGRVTVGLAVEGEWAALSVEDTGIGIEPEALPKLFEAFSQVDAAPERTQGGLGLGLALVKGLVELHGGRVQAASEGPGRGSRFTVWLPLDMGPAAPPRPGPPAAAASGSPPAAGQPRKVLIVEDNRDAAESLHMLLAAHGHEVAVAHTGPQGVEGARQFGPEVVLCDLGLPGMSGFDVAKVLRAEPVTAAALLISVSGYGQEQDCQRARDAGFDEALVKPVEPQVLLRLLARPRA
jgi:PAS domain S-box-containing protein